MPNNLDDMMNKVKELQNAFNKSSDPMKAVNMISKTYGDVLGLIAGVLETQQRQEKEIESLKRRLDSHKVSKKAHPSISRYE